MITPMTNYNLNPLKSMKNNNNTLPINSLKNIDSQQQTEIKTTELKKNNPTFKSMYSREATIILQNLSKDARTRLGTNVSTEYMKNSGFGGKSLNFLYKRR